MNRSMNTQHMQEIRGMGETMKSRGGLWRRIGTAVAAGIATVAMLLPVSGAALAAPTPQKLLDHVTDSSAQPAVERNSDTPVMPAQDTASDDDSMQPVIDADGYQQWKGENDTSGDEGIGWKIDNGTLYWRPWKGDSGTTGMVNLNFDVLATAIPWYTRRTEIKSIEASGTIYLNSYSDLLFYGCRNLSSIAGLAHVNATKMAYGRAMFQDCTSLKNLHGLENWVFSADSGTLYFGADSIYDNGIEGGYSYNDKAGGMFLGCSGLNDISALANWRIPKWSNAYLAGMFQDCTGLTNLHGLEDWTIYNATSIGVEQQNSTDKPMYSGMFSGCSGLTDLSALSGWKFKADDGSANVTSAPGLFSGCTGLTTLDALKNWDVSSIYDMNGMFSGCTGLTDASATQYWSIDNNMIMDIFRGCAKLQKIGVPATDSGYSQLVSISVPYDPSAPSQSGLNEDMPTITSEDGALGPFTWEQLYELMQKEPAYFKQPTVWIYKPAWILDYNANGGMGSMPSSTTRLADAATLPQCTFLRFGYEFIGWSTQPTDQVTLYKTGATWRPADPRQGVHYTLYAQWKKLGSGETGPISGDSGMLPGWVQVGSQGTQGTIPPNAVANAQFTNHYQPGAVAVTLKFTKLLDGNVPDKQFDFQLLDAQGTPAQTVHNAGAAVAFAPLQFTKAGEYTYFVNETGVSDTIDMDTHPVEVKITVSDDEQHKGNLKATVQLTGDTTFRNTSKPAQITLHKTVTGTTDTSKDFTFKVMLTGPDKQAVNGTYSGVTFTDGVGTVRMRAGASTTISGIPAYTTYSVDETELPAGYTLTSIEHATGILQAAGHSEVTADNAYRAKAAAATVRAVKYVQYGTNTPIRQIPAGTFRFSLCEVTGGSCNGVSEAANADDGSVVFPQLTYAATGVHEYRIREENTGRDGVTYDTRTVTATVTVTDDGAGQLHAAVATVGGAQVSGEDGAHTAVFVNQARQMMTMPHTGAAPWVALLVAAFASAFVVLCLAGRRRSGRHSA